MRQAVAGRELAQAQRGTPAKIVVWAHNSHLGDARATETSARGELNIGQLVRERHGGDCRLVGFTTYTGTVTAAGDWEGPAERKWVRPALAGSVEELLHRWARKSSSSASARRRGRPRRCGRRGCSGDRGDLPARTERQSHYFLARVADQFDAVIHVDETRALEPLERTVPLGAGRGAGDLSVRGVIQGPTQTVTFTGRGSMNLRFTGLEIPAASRDEFTGAGLATFAAFALTGLFTSLAPGIVGSLLQANHAVQGAVSCIIFAAATVAELGLARLNSGPVTLAGLGLSWPGWH